MTRIGPDSTLREIASVAFNVGLRVTFTAMPMPSRADRLTAEYGPRDVCWRWEGPWRRVEHHWPDDRHRSGWERFFSTPVIDDLDGTVYWNDPKRGYGNMNMFFLYDEGTVNEPWIPF